MTSQVKKGNPKKEQYALIEVHKPNENTIDKRPFSGITF